MFSRVWTVDSICTALQNELFLRMRDNNCKNCEIFLMPEYFEPHMIFVNYKNHRFLEFSPQFFNWFIFVFTHHFLKMLSKMMQIFSCRINTISFATLLLSPTFQLSALLSDWTIYYSNFCSFLFVCFVFPAFLLFHCNFIARGWGFFTYKKRILCLPKVLYF